MNLPQLSGTRLLLSIPSSVKKSIDSYFLTGVTGIKEIQTIRINVYVCLIMLITSLFRHALSLNVSQQSNLVAIITVSFRLLLLKLKMMETYYFAHTIFAALSPLIFFRKDEALFLASIAPLIYPIALYLFMMPIRHIFVVSVANACLLYRLKGFALEIFTGYDKTLQLEIIHNLYVTVFHFLYLSFIMLALSRFQFDVIVKDLRAVNLNLTEANHKQEQTLKLLEAANKELEHSKTQLEEALKAKDMLATVSHELRNPLNSLLGNIDLLLEEVTNKEQVQKLQIVKICGDVLLCLINNLLDAAKISADKLEVSVIPVNMYQFLEKVWRINSVIIKQKELTGELRVAKHFPKMLMVNSHRILQIFMNLISNAVKFTKKGSVRIKISWVKREAEFKTIVNSGQNLVIKQTPSIKDRATKSASKTPTKVWANPSYSQWTAKEQTEMRSESHFDTLPQLTEADDGKEKTLMATSVPIKMKSFKDIIQERYTIFHSDSPNISDNLENSRPTDYNTPRITDNSQSKSGHIKIEIVDTGCGIAKESQFKLFTPFTQEDAFITRKYGGTGLGLYIIKNLVTKMKGDITFTSEKNIGTTFTIQIPSEIVEESPSDLSRKFSSKMTNSSYVKYSGCVAMIVEDNLYNQTILKTYLKKFGTKSVICGNGLQAYELYISKPAGYFSFITMNLQMPVIDGITASRKIREYEQRVKLVNIVPIVVVTGNCSEVEKNNCLDPLDQVKASFFFRKPLTLSECSHFVSTIMNHENGKESMNLKVNLHLLVVDDDDLSLSILCQHLKNKNISFDVARNGLEAVQKVRDDSVKFDGVVMDCEMPVMDGIEATEEIKAFLKVEKGKDIPVYGLTGHADCEHDSKLKRAGMCKVFHKPVNFAELISVLLESRLK